MAKASKKEKAPPKKKGKKKGKLPSDGKDNYSFRDRNQVMVACSSHKVEFRCKIDGIPRPQYRAYGRVHKSSKLHVWNPSDGHKHSFRAAVEEATKLKKPQFSEEDPMELSVNFYFPRPKKHYIYNAITKMLHLRGDAPVFVTKVPDVDNLLKLVMDALQELLFKDDSSIAHIKAAKLWLTESQIYQQGQEQSGATVLRLAQFKQGTVEEGCECHMCKASRKSH